MHRREFLVGTMSTLGAGLVGGTGVSAALASKGAGERNFVRTVHGRIAYLERGQGPGALFLHGFPLSAYQWRDAIRLLAGHRRCIAPDFLGLGLSEPASNTDYAPETQVAMLVALLDRLDIESADVVASDSGGQAAQILVARHPGRVRSLLLTNCDTEYDSPPEALLWAIAMAKEGIFVDQRIAPQLADPVFARSPDAIGGLCYSDPTHPTDDAIADYFGPMVRSAARADAAHQFVIALERNPLVGIEPALNRFRNPVRIAWGTGDGIFKAENPRYLDSVFGNSRGVRFLEGRKVFWPEELPEVVAEEALALWSA